MTYLYEFFVGCLGDVEIHSWGGRGGVESEDERNRLFLSGGVGDGSLADGCCRWFLVCYYWRLRL